MTFVSYAQNFEDVLLWRALSGVTTGFYIDIGAAHPDIDSVTRAFYDRGWSGINVEPTEEYGLRLAVARPRDVNLQLVLGERRGTAELVVAEGTGLSTLDTDAVAALADAGIATRLRVCEMETLAEVCRLYAPPVIHFLKIDVEGAEDAVLAGANFETCRPWIVVVEATAPMSTVETHDKWERHLLCADYRFVWFDGLNRFYVSQEKAQDLAPYFRTPPNVFDDFVRAGDSEYARRIGDGERRSATLSHRMTAAEMRAIAAEARAAAVETHAATVETHAAAMVSAFADARTAAEQHLAELRAVLHNERQRKLEGAAATESWMRAAEARIQAVEAQRDAALGWLDAVFSSTSWRATSPLRRLRAGVETARPHFADPPALPMRPDPLQEAGREAVVTVAAPVERPLMPLTAAQRAKPGLHLRTVHQFHSGSAFGDAITNGMLLLRDVLRTCGYRSDIFVEHRAPELFDQLRLFEELPEHDRYVLIVHHSMGYDAFPKVAALRAPKILFYHNITPPEFLTENPGLQRYAAIGREQLSQWRDCVSASLAASEYNALELRTLGFDAVQACTMLFDVDRLLRRNRAVAATPSCKPFTVLFVGRVCAAKGQLELIDAYAAFHARFGGPSRLVLVGRHGGDADAYVQELRARVGETGVGESVEITGIVTEEALDAYYSAADVFVCLSRHEGFCVPLMEAIAHGVPVLARAAGAVSYTLGSTEGLMTHDAAEDVAAKLLELAGDPERRERLWRGQRAGLDRFRSDRQMPALLQALSHAGAAPAAVPDAARILSENMRFAVAGHVNGSYSLAAINRMLALHLEDLHPGRVRLVPVEGEPTTRIDHIPPAVRDDVVRLVERAKPATAPEILISQHYPVHVPATRGDLTVAFFFWEESIIPPATVALLSESFDAVFAPSRFVAKALIDSGVSIPVCHVGFTPRLDAFRPLAAQRCPRGATPFTFLHVSSCFPRKGVDVLLRAYAGAFRRGDAVRLIIKGFPNPHNDAAAQLTLAQEHYPDLADVQLIDRDLNEAELLALYAAADAMVLPTRGEGFNLPAAEALAAGLPVIVTGYGGHMDFCAAGQARLIDFTFVPSDSHLTSSHSIWVEPDEDDLAAALREVRAAPCRPPSAFAAVNTASRPWANIAAALLTAPPRQPIDIAWITSWDVRCGIAEYSRYLIEAMPASPAIGTITVLCDDRTAARLDAWPPTLPCWRLGLHDGASSLAGIIAVKDPSIVVIQHQPGLIGWAELSEFLAHRALRDRIVVVTLHTTLRLFDAPDPAQRGVLAELARIARVVVHTLDDLNRLKDAGLQANVVLIPQGAPSGAALPPPRVLAPNSFPLVGCYGFFLPDKGIPQLIRAVGLLRVRYPTIRLRLVNADYGTPDSRAEIAACRAIAETEGLADAIEWHTDFLPHDETRARLQGCDVIALPYQFSKEASSAALRSALSAGVPVLVTPLPLFAEAGDAVCRAPGLDAAALADGLARLLDSADARSELQLAASVWRQQRAWPIIATRTQGMLLGLAAASQ